ncbi:MAG: AAA domain-containing protein [Candidatus Methanomethylophilaceae archaeon]
MGSNRLYSELHELREKLRKDNTDKAGRPLEICSDEALTEMSLYMPTRKEHLSSIKGLDELFITEFGSYFLGVISEYCPEEGTGREMDKETVDILTELEKKLVNINKKNRMLYQSRLGKGMAFDLNGVKDTDFMELLFGSKNSARLCDLSDGKDQVAVYKDLSDMMREVNRNIRETGRHDLYVAYPFAQGKMPGEDFDIRSPLALFPVKMEKDSRHITLFRDKDRDVVLNGTLVLAYIKMSGDNRPIPDLVLEEYKKEDFLEKLIKFYSEQGISIDAGKETGTVPFKEYKTNGFPKYTPGQLEIIPNIVLGRYSSYSSAIHLDFEKIIERKNINKVLNDLVKDWDPYEFTGIGREPLSGQEIEEKGLGASEKDLLYINPLNSAQENVLTGIQKNDALVVQGPPGTGKSQVITALIVSEIMHGRNVLMVSEKKIALDVVYSRLGNLSKYCMLIDDSGDKRNFYNQISRMLEPEPPREEYGLRDISESVDNDFNILNGISKRMYKPDEFGISPYKLYSMDRWLDLNDRHQYEEYAILRDGINPELLKLNYREVKSLHDTFSDSLTLKGFGEYHDCLERNPWIMNVKNNLSEYDIGETKMLIRDLETSVSELKSKGALGRKMGRGKIAKEAEKILEFGFAEYGKSMVDMLLDEPRRFFDGLGDYDLFSERSAAYDRMTANEKTYGKNLLNLIDALKTGPKQCNDQMLKFILNDRLQKFDANNRDLMQNIRDFDRIVSDIDSKIEEKMELARSSAEYHFQGYMRNITDSKRKGDMLRVADSKRKWNINKFVERFDHELFNGIRVWLMTPDTVSEVLPLRMRLFDLVIFDEASQMYVERGIPSIYRARKVVVSGDHKQLRPSSLGFGRLEYEEGLMEDEAALEEDSLLDLARSRYDSILLNFHYRSRYEELIAFSNYAFYKGELYVSPNIKVPEEPPIEVHRVDGVWDNTKNKVEAAKIIELLKNFFRTRRENESVGILTFNAAQKDLISDMLDDECAKDPVFNKVFSAELTRFDNGEDVSLFIKNIETVQGDERDVIMFSIGYAPNPDGKMAQRFGWLNNQGGENRLNVAISRAKRKIHIVTSIGPENLRVEDVANDGPKLLKKYLQYSEAVSNGDTASADHILQSFCDSRWDDSPIIETQSSVSDRVYNSLVRKGYTVDRNVGIGGYRIDLAVKQNGDYILGIEIDGHLYGMSQSARERDYHRQKYLESNGWVMHRVWTPGMWKDPEREIAKIVKTIESRN